MFEIKECNNAFYLLHNDVYVVIEGRYKLKPNTKEIYYTSINALLYDFLKDFLRVDFKYKLTKYKNMYRIYNIDDFNNQFILDLDLGTCLPKGELVAYCLNDIFNKIYKLTTE